ncbi:MAG TPA: alpha/beta family hydrolase [Terracidiphilus sp.]
MTSASALSGAETLPGKTSLRTVDLRGPAGRLEALLNEGAPASRFAALVCHPHPLGGGTMHNKVVYHAMKVLNAPAWELQLHVLRFNFRGTGVSEGKHDGVAESEDVLAALDWLHAQYALPIVATGFSFGAMMSLAACCSSPRPKTGASIKALVAIGLPTQALDRRYQHTSLETCTIPKLFLSGDRDQFAPQSDLQQITHSAADPKSLVLISGADHFFTGRLDAMQNALASWLKEQLA